VVVTLTVVLTVVSFHYVGPNEMGLDYNIATKYVDNEMLYTEGNHYTGLGHYFIKYPRNSQTVRFDGIQYEKMNSRSSDGMNVILECSFQYNLKENADDISALFNDFGTDQYELAFVRVARNVLRDVASQYTAINLSGNMSTVEIAMTTQLQTNITDLHASISTFQLIDVQLPQKFNNTIAALDNLSLMINTYMLTYAQALSNSANQISQATIENQIIASNADKQKTLTQNEAAANIQALLNRIATEKTSLLYLKNKLSLSTKELITYYMLNNIDFSTLTATISLDIPFAVQCLSLDNNANC